MNGVSFQNAGTGVGVSNEFGAVIGINGLLGADAGQDALAPTGEAGEEVRFNKAFGNDQIRPLCPLVQPERAAGGQRSQMEHFFVAVGPVDLDTLTGDDLSTEFFGQFLRRGIPVGAGGNENHDLCVGRACADGAQHRRYDQLAGHGTGVVTGDQQNPGLTS